VKTLEIPMEIKTWIAAIILVVVFVGTVLYLAWPRKQNREE
jgi:hypothetical protein